MKSFLIVITLVFSLFAASCGKGSDEESADILARVGDDIFTGSDLRAAMPAGLNADDSVAFAKAYVRNWVNTHLVERVAASEVDMEQIERLTREYRDELIMTQYRRAMSRQATGR